MKYGIMEIHLYFHVTAPRYHAMKACREKQGKAHAFLTSALVDVSCEAQAPTAFSSEKKPTTNSIGYSADHLPTGVGLDKLEAKRKKLSTYRESNFRHPASSQSLN
jgi:hypothetical protein